MLAGCISGCDQGTQTNEATGGAPVEIVAGVTGPGAGVPIAPGQPIELAFDRLLMPLSIVRQTFVLEDVNGNGLAPPAVAYDPVSRVVTITPQAGGAPPSAYQLVITTPTSRQDPNGLRAIDGATLDPKWAQALLFPVEGDAGVPSGAPAIDFCSMVLPIFETCVGSDCHGPPPSPSPAAGLWLTSAEGVATTAIGRAAQGSNTGPTLGGGTAPQAPPIFGVDMPIIDNNPGASTGGDPGNSWLMYKLLMALPAPEDGGLDTTAYAVSWQPISVSERATLANLVPGREMPFPSNPATPIATGLDLNDLELLSFWIAQGANVPASCP